MSVIRDRVFIQSVLYTEAEPFFYNLIKITTLRIHYALKWTVGHYTEEEKKKQ